MKNSNDKPTDYRAVTSQVSTDTLKRAVPHWPEKHLVISNIYNHIEREEAGETAIEASGKNTDEAIKQALQGILESKEAERRLLANDIAEMMKAASIPQSPALAEGETKKEAERPPQGEVMKTDPVPEYNKHLFDKGYVGPDYRTLLQSLPALAQELYCHGTPVSTDLLKQYRQKNGEGFSQSSIEKAIQGIAHRNREKSEKTPKQPEKNHK